jgi:hypothetical protein|tara:strand:- start:1516 stop:1965 length:450 start_codon:yes stop_codon:yes gene_type:complete
MEKIKINTIIEIAGKPEEHVKETMNKLVDILEKNDKIEIIKKEIAPAKKTEVESPTNPEKKLEIYSSFIDLEMDLPNFDELMQFCYAFMPSSIEIIEPETLKIKQKDLEAPINDLLAKLHHQSKILMEYTALKNQINMLREKAMAQKKD